MGKHKTGLLNMFNRSQYEQVLAAIKKDKLEKILTILPFSAKASSQEKLRVALSKATPADWGDPKRTLGETVLGLALKARSFYVARFLVEIFKVKISSQELKASVEREKDLKHPRFLAFMEVLQRGDALPDSEDKKNWELYFNNRIKKALEKDEADELQYFAQIDLNWLIDYLDRIHFQDIFQRAASLGSLRCLQYLLIVLSEHRYKPDIEGNSLVQLAVKAGKAQIVEYLCDDVLYDLGNDRNRKGESVFDTARNHGQEALLPLLYRLHDPETLDILPTGLNLNSFRNGEELSLKGLTLMLHYFAKKNHYEHPVFLVQEAISTPGKTVAACLDLFVRSQETNLLLYSDNGVHRYIYKCEKYKDRVYVFALDSNTDWTDKAHVVQEMKKQYSESLSKLTFAMTQTRQQTADTGCHYYALKNISLSMKTPSLYQELEAGPYFTKPELVDGVSVLQFYLPARFMHLTTSPAKLADYVKAYPDEAKKKLRTTKTGQAQNLMEYSLHERNCYGMTTPELIKNRAYDEEDEFAEEEQFIQRNNTIWYFRNKYFNYCIPALVKEYSEEELKTILRHYDARNLLLSGNGKLTQSFKVGSRLSCERQLPSSTSSTVKTTDEVKVSSALVVARLFTPGAKLPITHHSQAQKSLQSKL
jgi:hypothetical protein